MTRVDYEQVDNGVIEMYVNGKRIAYWPAQRIGDNGPSVEGLSQVVDYLVNRIAALEAQVGSLMNGGGGI